uniref:Uncharacterized protein n=1 Tax=Meloidogyne javanica TaxID=6303 RepID=A0A915MTZ9_MELJA
MENCNNLTKFKKYCLDRLDYIYAAWNALNSYSEKLEVKNKRLEEERKTWEEGQKILEEKIKNLEEENNTLKEEKNLADKKLEEMTQVFNTFINQDVKKRNIFEENESPENVSRQSRVLFPVSPLPPRIEEKTIWDEDDDEEVENLQNEENLEENEDDCW